MLNPVNLIFNATLIAGAGCIACVGLIGINNVSEFQATYEADVYELTSYRCDLGYAGACDQLAALEAE